MKQEDKELLLKDLCARLSYGVKCQCFDEKTIALLTGIKSKSELCFDELDYKEFDGIVKIDYCKPYLFPMSSMTEEQNKEWLCTLSSDYHITYDTIDWLNKNYFDYRELIPMGLALNATGLNIY